ncbi:MAG: hypothetical protein ACRDRK_24730 [Pseudonocardia sp.]
MTDTITHLDPVEPSQRFGFGQDRLRPAPAQILISAASWVLCGLAQLSLLKVSGSELEHEVRVPVRANSGARSQHQVIDLTD